MRISDWSSDVCSSDLLAVKAMEEELVLAYVDGALAGCLFAAPRGDALYLGKIAVRPGLQGRGLARRLLAQIGRASCRERVCQYVLISVVAVTLNKTTNEQITLSQPTLTI